MIVNGICLGKCSDMVDLYSSGNIVFEHQVVSVYETNLHA